MMVFSKVENPSPGAETLKLVAAVESGMPVQFFVVSGPAEVKDDDTLLFLPIPPRSRYPVRVVVGAYQWGRPTEPKVQTVGPVFREFFLERPSK
jgi:hypothetical protein